MRSFTIAIASALVVVSSCAAEWNGRLFGKHLGDQVFVPADAGTSEMGLPYVEFHPEQIFLKFTTYAVWVTPTTRKTAAIVAVAEVGEDKSEAKILRQKAAMLLQTKYPEANATEDKDGDWMLTMKNGDCIGVEYQDGNVLIQAFRPAYLQRGISEFNKKTLEGKWRGKLFGNTLGDTVSIPADAETCELGLPIIPITPGQSWESFDTYAVWATPSTKKVASIIAVAEVGKDKIDAKLLCNKTVRLLKAKFPEAQEEKDESGDWKLTMENGDFIAVEIHDGIVLVQAVRPTCLQLGVSEFKRNVMSDKKNLDAL